MDDNYSEIFNHMIVMFGKFNNEKLYSGEQINFETNHYGNMGTLESGIDVGQGINVGPGKFV